MRYVHEFNKKHSGTSVTIGIWMTTQASTATELRNHAQQEAKFWQNKRDNLQYLQDAKSESHISRNSSNNWNHSLTSTTIDNSKATGKNNAKFSTSSNFENWIQAKFDQSSKHRQIQKNNCQNMSQISQKRQTMTGKDKKWDRQQNVPERDTRWRNEITRSQKKQQGLNERIKQ